MGNRKSGSNSSSSLNKLPVQTANKNKYRQWRQLWVGRGSMWPEHRAKTSAAPQANHISSAFISKQKIKNLSPELWRQGQLIWADLIWSLFPSPKQNQPRRFFLFFSANLSSTTETKCNTLCKKNFNSILPIPIITESPLLKQVHWKQTDNRNDSAWLATQLDWPRGF